MSAVRLEDVCFRWRRGDAPVLEIAEFEVARGERVLLRGPSGAGKTTLLNLLAGVAVPEAGRVIIGGVELGGLGAAGRDALRADRIGCVFQLFNLLPYLGMVENVLLPCRFSPTRRVRAVAAGGTARAEAERLLAHMGLDVTALAGRPVAQLSVGQQQRVAAARALIGAPELVIADEPTSALDAAARDRFLALMFAELAARGGSLLMVSHEAGLAERFDRVVELATINRAGSRADVA